MACSGKVNKLEVPIIDDEREILQLNTNDEKKKYLENIFEDDQRYRNTAKIEALKNKNGGDSEEMRGYVKSLMKQDSVNLIKVEQYLEQYGYPEKEMGEIANSAPWSVIHHAQSIEQRERNFDYIYSAYLKGDLDDSSITFYLGRMYEMKFNKRLSLPSPYYPIDEINQLINELGLEGKKSNISQIYMLTYNQAINKIKDIFENYKANEEAIESEENKTAMTKSLNSLHNVTDNQDLELLINIWNYYDPTDYSCRDEIYKILLQNKSMSIKAVKDRLKHKMSWESKNLSGTEFTTLLKMLENEK
jgi:hypothetical protein